MGNRIVVAGADHGLLEWLGLRLRGGGYWVGEASSIGELLPQLVHDEPSLVILVGNHISADWDVKEACCRVREVSGVMVMAMVGEGEVGEMLRLGVDDCVLWSVGWREFMARVRALMRRVTGSGEGRPAILAEGGLWVDFDSQEVSVRGKALVLTGKEFRLLAQLVRNRGQVVSHDRLLAEIRGGGGEVRKGLVRQYIYRLRRKIERDRGNPQAIVTHRGVGYCFDVQGL